MSQRRATTQGEAGRLSLQGLRRRGIEEETALPSEEDQEGEVSGGLIDAFYISPCALRDLGSETALPPPLIFEMLDRRICTHL
jgi:hypothetical protein